MVVRVSDAGLSKTSLREVEKRSWRLILTTAGTTLGAAVPGFVGATPTATLIGTILVGLLSALLTDLGAPTRAKAVAALLLTLVAATLTISGFTLADFVHGRSVFGAGQYTFPVPPKEPEDLDEPTPVMVPPDPIPPAAAAPLPAPAPLPTAAPLPAPTLPAPTSPPKPTQAPASNLTAPTHASPADDSVLESRDTMLIWEPVTGAAQYFVEVECLGCVTGRVWSPQANTTTTTTRHHFTWPSDSDGRWRITAIAADGTRGPTGTWWHFTYRTNTPPRRPPYPSTPPPQPLPTTSAAPVP